MKYYQVHVNNGQGYSIWFKANETLGYQGIIKKAVELNKIDLDDVRYVDDAEDTSRQDYLDSYREKYPKEDWKREVINNSTIIGYEKWVEYCIGRDEDDPNKVVGTPS
jgi:hypothetical protein